MVWQLSQTGADGTVIGDFFFFSKKQTWESTLEAIWALQKQTSLPGYIYIVLQAKLWLNGKLCDKDALDAVAKVGAVT